MRGLVFAAAALLLVAAGCSKPAAPMADGAVSTAPAAPAAAAKGAASEAAPVAVGPSLPQLAYSYDAQIEAPVKAVPALLARHRNICDAAGAMACQVVSAKSVLGSDVAHAELEIRAQPAWLAHFRGALGDDARAAGGRVVGEATKTEDLTRSIVDTEAALRARALLETRLEQLLATHQGKLSDLLEVERQLAAVQGEIDAAKSELAVMRARVATSDLTLSYDSQAPLAAAGSWRPLQEAIRGATGQTALALSLLVSLAAFLLPFAGLAVLVVLALRALRRRRPARPPMTPPPPLPETA